jgi:hypothetical protein
MQVVERLEKHQNKKKVNIELYDLKSVNLGRGSAMPSSTRADVVRGDPLIRKTSRNIEKVNKLLYETKNSSVLSKIQSPRFSVNIRG